MVGCRRWSPGEHDRDAAELLVLLLLQQRVALDDRAAAAAAGPSAHPHGHHLPHRAHHAPTTADLARGQGLRVKHSDASDVT